MPYNRIEMTGEKGTTRTNNEVTIFKWIERDKSGSLEIRLQATIEDHVRNDKDQNQCHGKK